MKDEHIIDINTLNKNNANLKTNINKKKQEQADKLNKQVDILKVNGYKEIEQYKVLIYRTINEIEKLSIFSKIAKDVFSEQIEFLCIDEILNAIVLPIFEGDIENMPFIEKKEFDLMRRDMFNSLIATYLNKDDPF